MQQCRHSGRCAKVVHSIPFQDCISGLLVGKRVNVWFVRSLSSMEKTCTSITDSHENSKVVTPSTTLRLYTRIAINKYTAEKRPIGCRSNWCWIVSDVL